MVSERWTGADFAPETGARRVDTRTGDSANVSYPIRIPGCRNAVFTTLSPSCVVTSLTLVTGDQENARMTAVHLRNHALAVRGEVP